MEGNTSPQAELHLQQGFVNKTKRKLVINKEFVEFETSDVDRLRIYWKDFKDMRYGVELIRGYSFYIGRKYRIYIRDQQQDEIRINLVSFYGIHRKQNHEDFIRVINAFHKLFIDEYVYKLMEQITQQETIRFEKLTVDNTGIHFVHNKADVSWEEVVIREYKGFFFLQNKSTPEQALKISYLEDWNGGVIYSLVKSSLQMLTMADTPSASH
jgi:hypothetical protein